MKVMIDRRWRVDASASVEAPVSARVAWGQVRDLKRFLETDPIHAGVRVRAEPGSASPLGAGLIIPHRVFGMGPTRIGRVLRWRAGEEIVFSDLSKRGVHVGFPHVCGCRIEPVDPGRSRVIVLARGKWTATWMPRWLVRLWIGGVLWATVRRINADFTRLAVWRARQGAPRVG